jgi:GNAT superfamily N-acetyltransferase
VAELQVRSAKESDAGAIAVLAGVLGYPTEEETMRGRVRAIAESAADLLLVAVEAPADEPIGWVQAHRGHYLEGGVRVHIVGLVVAPAAQRRGVGRLLMEEAERWAREVGAETIAVRSSASRATAHEFYPAVGYEKVKTQHVYLKQLGDS